MKKKNWKCQENNQNYEKNYREKNSTVGKKLKYLGKNVMLEKNGNFGKRLKKNWKCQETIKLKR